MSEIETKRPDQDAPDVQSSHIAAPDTPPAAARSAAVGSVVPEPDGAVRIGRSGPIAAQKLTRRGRVRKWDREPLPHDWRFFVGGLGKTLIAVGLLMFSFVGYQLYGTGIETAAAQSRLEDEFAQQLALADPASPDFAEGSDSDTVVDAPPSDGSGDVTDPSGDVVVPGDDEPIAPTEPEADPFSPADDAVTPPAVPVAAQNIPIDLQNGDAIAKIEIPSIGVSDIVVAGVDTSDLKRGPGHFPDTPLPGQLGNSAIAGHRTTYGQPFRNVDQLVNGDEIKVTTLSGVFVYKVTGQAIVDPSEYQVVATTDPTTANLTLTSCHPVFTARQRIVIFSELDRVESDPVGEPVINYGRPEVADAVTEIPGDVDLPADDGADIGAEPDGSVDDGATTIDPAAPVGDGETTGSLTDDTPVADQLGTAAVNEGIADAFSDGWFSDPAANSQVGLWGLVVGVLAIAAYAVSRRFRRDLLGLAVGLIPFSLALYFFFQNVNRLLPPNL